jgi:isopentenyldiphosphate isomerase
MELLDVLDEDGNQIGKVEDKDIIHDTGLWHKEVAVLIQNEKGEYLIQKRAATKKQGANKWGLTAGHVEAEESYENAIIREIKEELGIRVKIEELKPLGIFKQKYESEKTTNNTYTKYYYYKTNRKIEEYTICLEELSQLKYITFEQLETIVKNRDEEYCFTKRVEPMEQIIKLLKK